MIIGVLSDAHGNEEGFFKCYRYLKAHADLIFYLGDCVGYFPLSNLLIDTLFNDKVICLKGNHEAMLLNELAYDTARDETYQLTEARNQITKRNKEFLSTLVSEMDFIIDGRKIKLVHGSPLNPLNGYVFQDSDFELFNAVDADVVFMGHTHIAFNHSFNDKLLVNVGSCGFSRDSGNVLTVALYDSIKNEVVIRAIELNVFNVLRKYGTVLPQNVKDSLNRNHSHF